ncbi:hypothetical protein Dimus_004588 [Dionaea muscipula]
MAVVDAAVNRFPEGMRVLVVDDDPTSLKLLETLLKKCEYNVTTTNQAVSALNLLKENKFDIVISDVHMPDMDGFELLQLVGLDLDTPVIMLSAYGDPKLVMKGIRHGAVDYLLKPVRIQELKNIWQHVVRKNRLTGRGKGDSGDNESRREPAPTFDDDQDVQLSRKRKGSGDEDEEDERDDDSHENEDSATQKKPRVIWSKDLHEKFVSAVEELGKDKAFPKKILDLMKVEGLTRENVASHLQKYRIFLKKLNNGSSPQMNNMANTLGGRELYDSFGVNHYSLVDLGKIRAAGRLTSSYQPGGILGRLNTTAGVGLRQQTTARGLTFNSSLSSFGNFQPLSSFPNQNANPLLHGIPLQQHLHQLYQNAGDVNRIPDLKPVNGFAACDLVGTRMPHGSTSSSLLGLPSTRMPSSIANGTLLGPSSNSLISTGNPSVFNIPTRNIVKPIGGFGSSSTDLMMAYQDKYNNRDCSDALQSSVPVNSNNFIGGIGVQSDPMDNLPMTSLEGFRENMQIEGDGLADVPPSSNGIAYPSSSNPVVPARGSRLQNGAALAYNGNIHGYPVCWPNDATPLPILQQNEIPGWENGSKPRLVDNFIEETSTILEDFTQNRYESLEDVLGCSLDRKSNDTRL